MSKPTVRLFATAFVALVSQVALLQAQTGTIEGTVSSSEDGRPIANASVIIRGTDIAVATDDNGAFIIRSLRPGTYNLRVSFIGYRTVVRAVEVGYGSTTRVEIELIVRPIEVSGIEVSVLRPDLGPQAELESRAVREANPTDTGQLMRKIPGSDSGRKGHIGFDPVVRGLSETEVGVYLDGTRMFPAGPARMDSPLSHVDPSSLVSLDVVKGPYALTWGAGNLSAIRVTTQDISSDAGPVRGRLAIGTDLNAFAEGSDIPVGQSGETYASLYGNAGRVFYWGHGLWRGGNDYRSGDGTMVPGDFSVGEVRGKLGYRTSVDSRLTFSAGYQDQGRTDYPGRILDARLFKTLNLAGRWELERRDGTLRKLDFLAYVNNVDHEMDNDDKPTAQPNPDRMPPFPLEVVIESEIDVSGGRAAAALAPGSDWEFEVGGDIYNANRKAIRSITNRMPPPDPMLVDLMWPDARIIDGGLFARANRRLGGIFSGAAAVRVDFVDASADTASEFFVENVSTALESNETNWSGSFTLSAKASQNWMIAAGVGSAVRTADAAERYSDRIPATKSQLSAEFVGNPNLDPERGTQVDLWIEAGYPRFSVFANGFYRWMSDYITIEATDLPKRLPLSPETVFQYVNGDARYTGFELGGSYAFLDQLTGWLTGSYLWGHDDSLDESAFGVSPPQGRVGLRYEPLAGNYFIEGALNAAAEMDSSRVSASRGETPTDGYVTFDLQGAVEIAHGVQLRLGVLNIVDENYVNHLNAKNPFTGQQIPEPGRTWIARLQYVF